MKQNDIARAPQNPFHRPKDGKLLAENVDR